MAAPNPNPAPIIRVEYPTGTHKRDALTVAGNGPEIIYPGVQTLLTNAINGNQPANPNIRPTPFDNAGAACYRNAALGVLLNLKPFLNYLYAVTATNTNISSLTLLRDIAAIYWHPTASDHDRYARIQDKANRWYSHLIRQHGQIPHWDTGHIINQADVVEFLSYVLNRAHDHELMGNDQRALQRLGKFQLVQRLAYTCQCNEKRRQQIGTSDLNDWCLQVNITTHNTPLEQLIAEQRLYTFNDQRFGTCPTCNTQQIQLHEYNKFQFMPEFIFIGVNRFTAGNVQDMTLDTTTPEIIDLSYLQDHPPSASNSTNPVKYRLEAVIAYYTNGTNNGHYNVHIRRSDGSWTEVDDSGSYRPVVNSANLTIGRGLKPRMLVYVRIHSASGPSVQIAVPAVDVSQPVHTDPGTYPPPPQQPPATTSQWDKARWQTEFYAIGLPRRNFSNLSRFQQEYNNYWTVNSQDRFRQLTVDALTSLARRAGYSSTTNPKKDTLVQWLQQKWFPTAPPDVPPDVPPTPPGAPMPPPGSTSLQTLPRDQLIAQVATLTADNVRIRGENTRIRSQVTQLTNDAQTANDNFQNARNDLQASNTNLQNERNARARDGSMLNTMTQTNQTLTDQNNLLTQQALRFQAEIQRLRALLPSSHSSQQHSHGGSQRGGGQQDQDQHRSQPQHVHRYLRVTTTGVIEPNDRSVPWQDQITDLPVLQFVPGQPLNTRQWFRKVTDYQPDDSPSPATRNQKYVVTVVIQSQTGREDTIYEFDVPVLGLRPIPTEPTLQAELTTIPSNINRPAMTSVIRRIQRPTRPPTDRQSPTRPSPRHSPRQSPVQRTLQSAIPSLTINVAIGPQLNGTPNVVQSYTLPIPQYNSHEYLNTTTEVQMTGTNGNHPPVHSEDSSIDHANRSALLNSTFQPIQAVSPTGTDIFSSPNRSQDRTSRTITGETATGGGSAGPTGPTVQTGGDTTNNPRRRRRSDSQDDHPGFGGGSQTTAHLSPQRDPRRRRLNSAGEFVTVAGTQQQQQQQNQPTLSTQQDGHQQHQDGDGDSLFGEDEN